MIRVAAVAIGLTCVFTTGFVAAWKIQSTKISTLMNEQTQSNMDAQKSAFLKTEIYAKNIVKAETKSVKRKQAIRVAVVYTGNAGNGLRLTSKDSLRESKDSLAACVALNTKYDLVLDAASSEAERLANAADNWEADALKLLEAWPK
jgi:hypothetical protein